VDKTLRRRLVEAHARLDKRADLEIAGTRFAALAAGKALQRGNLTQRRSGARRR
jgi:hypothetical protein